VGRGAVPAKVVEGCPWKGNLNSTAENPLEDAQETHNDKEKKAAYESKHHSALKNTIGGVGLIERGKLCNKLKNGA